jgi:hypothetical protein
MQIQTSELQRVALNWAVAKLEQFDNGDWLPDYCTDWAAGGSIIEREKLTVAPNGQKSYVEQEAWTAYRIETLFTDQGDIDYRTGPTPLIAAMRCYVASKLGDTVEIPEELK